MPASAPGRRSANSRCLLPATTRSRASGQVASAGTDVDALRGPLKTLGLKGVFGTDDIGKTRFRFTGDAGLEVTCT